MNFIHQATFYLHVSVGSCALLVFWIPVFARKGSLNHKKFGRYFALAMYTMSFTGFIMSGLDLLFPLLTHPLQVELPPEAQVQHVRNIRGFALFLFSLSALVLATTRHGWLVMLGRDDRSALRAPVHLIICLAVPMLGLLLLIVGFRLQQTLFMIFGAGQIVLGVNQLRYIFKEKLINKEWWTEHLGGLIGSGIGAYTAFFVFGGQRLFESLFSGALSDMMIILWVAPGVIGGVSIGRLSRRYKDKFSKTATKQVLAEIN